MESAEQQGDTIESEAQQGDTMDSAAQQGDIERLYRLIEENPRVLEEIDSTPFVQTPLHIAARKGHVEFATEIMTLKPSFAWKLNPQGLRPVHLALEHGHTTMVLHLIQMDKELVRAKKRGGLTLFHLASKSGDINLLTQFLKACPDSVKDFTPRGETALQLAETNNHTQVSFNSLCLSLWIYCCEGIMLK